jgi:hypothetical protein
VQRFYVSTTSVEAGLEFLPCSSVYSVYSVVPFQSTTERTEDTEQHGAGDQALTFDRRVYRRPFGLPAGLKYWKDKRKEKAR